MRKKSVFLHGKEGSKEHHHYKGNFKKINQLFQTERRKTMLNQCVLTDDGGDDTAQTEF